MSEAPSRALKRALDALCGATDIGERLARDPLWFARRYAAPADQEVAAIFASSLAFGRVSLFWPVLSEVMRQADARGGPHAWVTGFGAGDAAALAPLVYRWNRGPDLALLARTLQAALAEAGRIGAIFEGLHRPGDADLGPTLEAGVATLRAFARAAEGAQTWGALPRGFRTFLPTPSEGSACKRWNMLLRWMVRRPGPTTPDGQPARADAADLGLWALPPAGLIIPLDTHVGRIARYVGLTQREDGSWRTAVEITSGLRRLDPEDPVRYDFALAHLGISGQCSGAYVPPVCGACALQPVCRVGNPSGIE